MGDRSLVNDQPTSAKFDVSRVPKGLHDAGLVQRQQPFQFEVRDIACRDVQEPRRASQHQMGIDEVAVLADQHAVVAGAQIAQVIVRRAVAGGEIECVKSVMPTLLKQVHEPARELSVDQKSHETPASMLLTRLNRAAYAKAARISSRSRS